MFFYQSWELVCVYHNLCGRSAEGLLPSAILPEVMIRNPPLGSGWEVILNFSFLLLVPLSQAYNLDI
jgi:hypothetical protein